MSARLFVDVDDTLVRWLGDPGPGGPHPYGASATSWEPNQEVIAAIERWRAKNPGGHLIVWSGGGHEYASTWAHRLLPEERWTTTGKFNPPTRDGDVFIDDMPFDAWSDKAIHPRDIAAWVPA